MSRAYLSEDVNALIFDIGSRSARIGYAGTDIATFDISSVAGVVPNFSDDNNGNDNYKTDQYYFGDMHLKANIPNMEIHNFMSEGCVSNWLLFEEMINFVYTKQLCTQPDQHPVLFSEHVLNPRENRERLCEIMFEKFEIPAIQIIKNPVLSLFSQGKSNGVVLDIGHNCTVVAPVLDGYTMLRAVVQSSTVAGYPLLQYYKKILKIDNKSLTVRVAENATQSYKDYIGMSVMMDLTAATLQLYDRSPYDATILEQMPHVTYELPDRTILDIGEERYRTSERLFSTHQYNIEEAGKIDLASMINSSVRLCDVDVRLPLYSNIFVVGGVSLIPGIVDRLSYELSTRVPHSAKLKVVSPSNASDKLYSTYIGGSIIASLGSFHSRWISKHEFSENGNSIVHKKCL
ncbi:hypothetical protein GJ496_005527 [Pomphorhynchus laevis]|nr:hypothetical protein GJ496_005527 [Pomphorhynchus laevis]